jgi:hypothetical protein
MAVRPEDFLLRRTRLGLFPTRTAPCGPLLPPAMTSGAVILRARCGKDSAGAVSSH